MDKIEISPFLVRLRAKIEKNTLCGRALVTVRAKLETKYKHKTSADILEVGPYSVPDCSSTEMFEILKASKVCFVC